MKIVEFPNLGFAIDYFGALFSLGVNIVMGTTDWTKRYCLFHCWNVGAKRHGNEPRSDRKLETIDGKYDVAD